MSQYLDVGQWLSFISGYRKATKLPKTRQAKINEFLKVANEDLRKLIESSTPVFFLYNSEVYSQACVDFAKSLQVLNSGNLAYVTHIVVDGVHIQKDEKEFYTELLKCLSRYRPPTFDKTQVISKVVTKKNTIESFSSIVEKQLSLLNSKIEKQYLHLMADDNPKKEWAAGRARFSTVATGRAIRTAFQKLTPCSILNPESIVENFNSKNQEILLGSTFSNLRDSVNSILTPLAIESFLEAGIALSNTTKKSTNPIDSVKRFSIGEIVVFGHTGAKTTSDGLAQLIGLNTPWTQQILLLAAEKGVQGNAFDLLNQFAIDSGQVQASVQFTKSVSDKVKVLMKGQLAIVVPMSVSENKLYREKEGTAAGNLIESIFGKGSTYLKVRGSLIDRILSAAWLKRLATGLRFSPTLTESLKQGLISTAQTGRFKKSFAQSTKESISVTKNNVVKNSKSIVSPKKLKLPKPNNKPIRKNKFVTQFSTTSLSSLLVSINQNLHDQIKKNMGTGTDRRVLNYRTGRLARSAKVERISESRQGMITAFYSYMKNPYATFSEGGRQQYPRSRDPKTLISKSVREIAQTLVTNQLRAVNV